MTLNIFLQRKQTRRRRVSRRELNDLKLRHNERVNYLMELERRMEILEQPKLTWNLMTYKLETDSKV